MNLVELHNKDILKQMAEINDKVFRGPHQCNTGPSEETALDIRTREQYIMDNDAELAEICKSYKSYLRINFLLKFQKNYCTVRQTLQKYQ